LTIDRSLNRRSPGSPMASTWIRSASRLPPIRSDHLLLAGKSQQRRKLEPEKHSMRLKRSGLLPPWSVTVSGHSGGSPRCEPLPILRLGNRVRKAPTGNMQESFDVAASVEARPVALDRDACGLRVEPREPRAAYANVAASGQNGSTSFPKPRSLKSKVFQLAAQIELRFVRREL
jgi:hypothetical protein